MFNYIRENATSNSYDYIAENTSASVDALKNAFLDDPEAMTIGAENDPKISKFVETIPEDDEVDELSEKEVDELTEAYDDESDDEIDDYISSGDYDDIEEAYDDESDDEIDDYISSGDYDDVDESYDSDYDIYNYY